MDAHAVRFASPGCTALFATIQQELGDDYMASIDRHVANLKFRSGVLVSAELAFLP